MSSAAATAAAPAPPVATAPPVPAPLRGTGSPVASGPAEPISVGALMFVLITALLAAIASLVDVVVSGWLSALAHLAWAAGVFAVVGLLLGLAVSVVSQLRRAHAASSTAPPTSFP